MQNNKLEILQNIHKSLSKISNLTFEDFLLIKNIIKIENYEEGSTFLNPGDSSQKAGILISGLCKTYYLTEDGKENISHFGTEGSFIAVYTDMLKNIPSTGTIQFLESSKILVVDFHELLEATKENLAWTHLLRIIAQNRYIYRSETSRNINLKSASDRFNYFLENNPKLRDRLPLNQIALYLNIAPATLSRLRNNSGNYKN